MCTRRNLSEKGCGSGSQGNNNVKTRMGSDYQSVGVLRHVLSGYLYYRYINI